MGSAADVAVSGTGGEHSSLRPLLTLLFAGTLGRLPFVTLPVAALLLVDDRSGLGRAGLASGAVSLGAGLIGIVVGRRLDGPRSGRLLIALTLAHIPAVALFIAVAGDRRLLVLGPAAFLAGCTVPPVAPVVRALLAQRTRQSDAQRVFAYDSIAVEVTWIGGPLIVSLAVLVAGPALAVALSPLFAAVGVAAVFRQRPGGAREESGSGPWLTRPVVQLLLSFAVAGMAFRVVIIAIAAVAKAQGHADASGLLLSVWAVGSLIGGVMAARGGMPSTFALGMALAATIGAVGLGTGSIWATGALVFVSGVPTAPFVASLNALVSVTVSEHAHARAFAAMQAGSTLFSAAGAAVGGVVIDRFGPAVVCVPAAAIIVLSAVLSRVPSPHRSVIHSG